METENLADLYDLAPLDWAPVRARLEQPITMAPGTGGPDRHTCWLATTQPDGRPHGLDVVETLTSPDGWGTETTTGGGRIVWGRLDLDAAGK